MATANSKINKAICPIIKKLISISLKEEPVLPNNVNKRWPAIILAERRIAKVPGRIILLIVSIHTIKGIRIEGVPKGTKWVNMWIVFWIQPKIINLIHKGKARVKVITIWLVLVKI